MTESLITQHIDLWTSAIEAKSTAGRGSKNKFDLYGIKKLRELILELAVRGKLVPQDPSDEPASLLVDKIISIQNALKTSEGLKTDASLAIKDDEYLIEIPNGWSLCRLGNLAKFIDYRGKTPNKVSSGVRLITAKNIKFGFISKFPEEYISQEDYSKWMTRGYPRVNDILFTTEAPLGNVAIIDIDDKFALAQRAICFQFHEPKISKFMLFQLMSPYFQKSIYDKQSGMTALGIKASRLKEIVIILPPLAEQHRIVAKVDELMALCDQLEQQTLTSIDAHATLVDTLLETLTNSADAVELEQNWARISGHFDTLFTTEQSIDALKQTILQLAVMGKLVRQDPTDEPASVLLEKIAAEKAQLIKDKKIKKEKPFVSFEGLDALKKELPIGWKWVRLADIAELVRGGSPRPAGDPRFYGGDIPFLKVGDVTRKSSKFVESYNETIKDAGLQKTRLIETRTVLLSNSGATLGIPAICEFSATFNDGIAAFIEQSKFVFDEYLYLYLSSMTHWFLTIASRGQGQPNLNTDIIKSTWFPLAPIEEQYRIVAKVDNLFDICEQIKQSFKQSCQTQLFLTDSIIDEALR